MGFLSDTLKFEGFNLKDMLKKVKKDPERLFLGAADPFGSKVWGNVLGKDYEPIVDQMGGAYGGHAISAFGDKNGGVYGRAQDAGINTGPGGSVHDAAHILSSLFAGNYGMGKLGGVFDSQPAGQGGFQSQFSQMNQMMPPQQQQQQQIEQRPLQPWEFRPYQRQLGYDPNSPYAPTSLGRTFGIFG